MTRKRMISLGLSAALALSLSAPAMASGIDVQDTDKVDTVDAGGLYKSGEVEIAGNVQAPVINVTVPKAGGVIINPYKMAYDWTATGGVFDQSKVVEKGTEDTAQIISPTQFITNDSNVAISVSVDATGVIDAGAKDVTLSATAPTAKDTTKKVFMYFEMQATAKNDAVPTWAEAYDKTQHLVLSTTKATKTDMVTLAAGTTDGASGTIADAINKGAFHFAGATTEKPANPWVATDKVGAKLVFTFTPVIPTAE